MDIVFQYPSAEAQAKCEGCIFIIKRAARTILTGVVTIGTELIYVKEALDYTQFTPWLEANFNWSCATAENYMNAARAVKQYPLKAPLCSLQTLYLLTNRLPQEVKDEIMQAPASFNEARLIISERKAAAWEEAIELAVVTTPGQALYEIEQALEHDPSLRVVAAELLAKYAEKFALLSDREPRELLVEAGLSLEEQFPGKAFVPRAIMKNDRVTMWVGDTSYEVFIFPKPSHPIVEAAQNAAIRAVCAELGISVERPGYK